MRAAALLVPTLLLALLAAAPGARAGERPLDVEATLAWLRTRQAADGGWRERGDVSAPGLTAQCILAHLAGGWTHRGKHESATALLRAFRFLKKGRTGDGTLSTSWLDHAWATLAFMEGHGMTESKILEGVAVRGWERLMRAVDEDPAFAEDARLAGVALLCKETAVRLHRSWARHGMRAVGSGALPRTVLYVPHPAADAILAGWMRQDDAEDPLRRSVATLARILYDRTAWGRARLEASAAWFDANPPTWSPAPGPTNSDPLAWRLGAPVVLELRGATYRIWRKAAREGFSVRKEGGPDGLAWDPQDLAGYDGGRIELAALISATYDNLTPCYSLPESLRGDG